MDRFRIDDPDAAEKAAKIWAKAGGYDWPSEPEVQKMQAVLDAIERPRLPTRSEVARKFGNYGQTMWMGWDIADVMRAEGWATEDPEPEADPLVTALGSLLLTTQDDDDVYGQARRLLASGRVQVTPQ